MAKRSYPSGTTRARETLYPVRRQANITEEMEESIVKWAKAAGVTQAEAVRLLLGKGLGAKWPIALSTHNRLLKDLRALAAKYGAA